FGSGFPGPNCFKDITITANGKTATAQIIDKASFFTLSRHNGPSILTASCPGCPEGGLDLSPSLFSKLGDESQGVLTGEWSFD
ncbi:uncharacterized protein FOMMEDRAFT_95827, partial [Fomitiporia mediterranea MF3/22]|uniref:uncharacterized protein n=1 Tax=Fomitiporia mediterranea (strain MF3/22) TaxID=694068 RepID=UPI0004407522